MRAQTTEGGQERTRSPPATAQRGPPGQVSGPLGRTFFRVHIGFRPGKGFPFMNELNGERHFPWGARISEREAAKEGARPEKGGRGGRHQPGRRPTVRASGGSGWGDGGRGATPRPRASHSDIQTPGRQASGQQQQALTRPPQLRLPSHRAPRKVKAPLLL